MCLKHVKLQVSSELSPTTSKEGSSIFKKERPPEEKKIDDDIIKELAKKFETVMLANMNRQGPKGKEPFRCVW